jgi:hypothetical protein
VNIPLHPEKGVNPHMTYCPMCNGDGPDLLLVGRDDGVYECSSCHVMQFGRGRDHKCGSCGERLGARVRSLKDGERLPGSLCAKCEAEAKAHAEIVAAGGVYWRCTNCRKGGVIKPNAYTKQVRDERNVQPPAPLGVEFVNGSCPLCSKEPAEAIKDADQVERGGSDGAAAPPA